MVPTGQPNQGPDVVVQGFVRLTRAIVARSGLKSLDEANVVPYLREKLAWRVRTVSMSVYSVSFFSLSSLLSQVSGNNILLDDKTSLEIIVFSVRVGMGPISDPTTIPDHGEPRYYQDITAGRPGGSHIQ